MRGHLVLAEPSRQYSTLRNACLAMCSGVFNITRNTLRGILNTPEHIARHAFLKYTYQNIVTTSYHSFVCIFLHCRIHDRRWCCRSEKLDYDKWLSVPPRQHYCARWNYTFPRRPATHTSTAPSLDKQARHRHILIVINQINIGSVPRIIMSNIKLDIDVDMKSWRTGGQQE